MTNELPSFQCYQLQFASYLRNPNQNKAPKGARQDRMRVYAEIVFNNLISSVSACYPVSSKVLGKRAWRKLVRGFFREYQSDTPIFREIPEQFLHYLNTRDDLPIYLPELAHYEWIELAVSMRNVEIPETSTDQIDLLEHPIVINPSLESLSYSYPVHMISPRIRPYAPLAEPVHLLVYRNKANEVKFMEINAITARLIELLNSDKRSGRQALEEIASEIAHPNSKLMIEFGATILLDLKNQGVIF